MIDTITEGNTRNSTEIKEILHDFWICCLSRECSLAARRDVLSGKGSFGITGDGKEVAQICFAKAFKKGDHRAGYYRDQTFMMALGLLEVKAYFAQLYGDTKNDPFSGGRQMNNHFATPYINADGSWTEQKDLLNISSDISSTAGQVARGFGLAMASKKYRDIKSLNKSKFSDNGNEVAFVTIGDASTSEGAFWETINAAGVLQVPLAISVWDDGYGISVPKKFQTTKSSISKILAGFQIEEGTNGIDIYLGKGWDYPGLVAMYKKGIDKIRNEHIPALFHVEEVTQPQGHSTSGSHERYKSAERLQWEKDFDCIDLMGKWMISEDIITEEEILSTKKKAKDFVKKEKLKAWKEYLAPIKIQKNILSEIFNKILLEYPSDDVVAIIEEFRNERDPMIHHLMIFARRMNFELTKTSVSHRTELKLWMANIEADANSNYHTHLVDETEHSALNVEIVDAVYSDESKELPGYLVLNRYFDLMFAKHKNLFTFGEDVGQIGGVNQGLVGLQAIHGKDRIFDTAIREWTIIGQGIGMAMRGLRPIAEIQYLDYLVYGLPPLTDDLATLRYRSNGIQAAPLIIRTRGHRLEGIWHTGSPMGMLLGSLRGIHVCVPRNMVQAVGFYNTLLAANDPGLVIEPLNGYRLRQTMPDNIGDYNTPLGIPEILTEGADITLVTYGSCVRIAEKGVEMLAKFGVSVELIDVQTLLPFDLDNLIGDSLEKTNKIVFLDEDFPGGATAYMMQQVIETNQGFFSLDMPCVTLTAKAHRVPYGSDGDYFSKPNAEDVFETIYNMMHEEDPNLYPAL